MLPPHNDTLSANPSATGGPQAPRPAHAPPPSDAPPPVALEVRADEAVLRFLATRRSPALRTLAAPGPAPDEVERLLALASRVPDHGRLVPWRFIVLEGAARSVAGRALDGLYARQNPNLDAAKATMWHDYLMRAPVVVVLVSRPDPSAKIPVWHQELAAGAVGMALTMAAGAMGYASQWLLKWPVRDAEAAALLGIKPGERAAGMFHIGHPSLESPPERARPDMAAIVTRWSPPDQED